MTISILRMRFTEAYLIKSKSTMVAGIIDDIRRIFFELAEQARKAEHEAGLTGSQLWAIKILDESSPMTVTELARRMYLHPATMVGLLDRLEAKGLVQRTRSDRDRRVVHVRITAQGLELVQNSPEVAQRLLVEGLEPLTERKVKSISIGVDQIVKILGVQKEPPKLIHSSEVNLPGRRRKSET
jgi:MarR family transcriptional regulator, organic hydroperoxide resistance regulator